MTAAIAELDGKRSVLGRAFDTLECFIGGEAELSFAALCTRTGLPPATMHRQLTSLVESGALERAGRGRYRLGHRLWRLGNYVPSSRALKDVARPCLVDLHAVTREVAVLASVDGDRMIVADVIAGRSAYRSWPAPRYLPVATSAPGLAVLAHLPAEDAATLLARVAGRAGGAGRGLDFAARQRLSEIRQAGAAVVPHGGHVWVSAPVFGASGQVRSTVSAAAAPENLNVPALSRVVIDAARAVTQGLRDRAEAAC